MQKKLTAILMCVLLLPCLVLPAFAQSISYIFDDAGLLLPEEISALEDKVEELASLYGIDPVILTVESLYGNTAQDCADDYYDNAGFRDDGVLFLLAMSEREWYISTCGDVMYALTDYGVQQLGETIVPYLAGEYWFDGFCHFLDTLPHYLDAYQNGTPIDGQADISDRYYHGEQEEILYYKEASSPNFFFSLGCGILAAGIAIVIMRSSMRTKRAQRTASAYMKDGSWNLYQHRDLFLYSNVTKTRRQESKPIGSGGGSSVHRASSGRHHGGGGGKF